MPKLRTFIALELPEHVRASAATAIRTLKNIPSGVKWVTPANLHITLKFLGDITEDRIPAIRTALAAVAQSYPAFQLTTGTLDAFPSTRNPEIIFIGLEDQTRPAEISKDIETALTTLGFEQELRPYKGHITIGRFKSPQGKKPMGTALNELGFERQIFAVSALTLFQSTLYPDGPVYEPIERFALGRSTEPGQGTVQAPD